MSRYTVVMTGASGSVYGLRLVEQLLTYGAEVMFIATPMGAEVMAYETGLKLPQSGARDAVLRFLEQRPDLPLRVVADDDMFDAAASGSSPTDGVIVCPCSMGFVGSVAAGLGADLAERAADVALKEGRRLVLVPRETPLSLIHLRNLTTLAEAGAMIVPAMPAFYTRPTSLDDAVNFVVGKVLDVLGVEHDLYPRWRA